MLTTQSLFKFIFAKHFLGVFFFNFLIKILNNRTALAPLSEQQAKFWIKTDYSPEFSFWTRYFYVVKALYYDSTAKYPIRRTDKTDKISFVCEKFN